MSFLFDLPAVLQLVTRCPDLTKLVIRNCFPVPDNFLLPLLDQCPALKSLTILSRPRSYYGMEYTAAGRKLKELVSGKYPQQTINISVDLKRTIFESGIGLSCGMHNNAADSVRYHSHLYIINVNKNRNIL